MYRVILLCPKVAASVAQFPNMTPDSPKGRWRMVAPPKSRKLKWLAVALLAWLMSCSLVGLAQTTVGTGSIVGTVTDPSSAVLGGAKVTITNLATGHVMTLTTNSSGAFNS
ncbi:MAG: carboxypeptidase-like regulatory domain-containing protein, partial [Terriglobales bacterium]